MKYGTWVSQILPKLKGNEMLLTDSGSHEYEQPPTGSFVARCIKIVDIGTQKNEYQGVVNYKRQGIFTWELPGELMTEGDWAGKPFTVSKFYTLSLSEKANLRRDLESWRAKPFTPEELGGFDPKKVLGAPCMLGLIENAKGKTVVGTVMALPKGMPVPEQVNPSVYFSLDKFDRDVFDSLSKGIQGLIEKSPEYQNIKSPVAPEKEPGAWDDLESDVPFFDHLGRTYWRVV